jgi:hypothetical protein
MKLKVIFLKLYIPGPWIFSKIHPIKEIPVNFSPNFYPNKESISRMRYNICGVKLLGRKRYGRNQK